MNITSQIQMYMYNTIKRINNKSFSQMLTSCALEKLHKCQYVDAQSNKSFFSGPQGSWSVHVCC